MLNPHDLPLEQDDVSQFLIQVDTIFLLKVLFYFLIYFQVSLNTSRIDVILDELF